MCLVSIFFIDTFFLVRAGSSLYFLLTKIIRAKLFQLTISISKLKPPACQKEKKRNCIEIVIAGIYLKWQTNNDSS